MAPAFAVRYSVIETVMLVDTVPLLANVAAVVMQVPPVQAAPVGLLGVKGPYDAPTAAIAGDATTTVATSATSVARRRRHRVETMN